MAVFAAVIATLWPKAFLGWYLLNLVLFELFLRISILPHELGHALGARLMGWKVFQIIVGSGRRIFRTRWMECDFEFRAIPSYGITIATPIDGNYSKIRHASYVAAGPLVNVLIIPIAYWCISAKEIGEILHTHWLEDSAPFGVFGQKLVPLEMLIVANLLLLIIGFWPRFLKTDLGNVKSDGLALHKILFSRVSERDAICLAYYFRQGLASLELRDLPAVEKWCEEGLKKFPENNLLVNLLGVNLVQLGRYSESRECFLKLLAQREIDAGFRCLLLNNIAYADVMLDDPALVDEADRNSKEATAKIPWLPLFWGTRAIVLVALGQIEEGIKMLQESGKRAETPRDRASNLCHLALAEHKRGNREACGRLLETAGTLDPASALLKRVESICSLERAPNSNPRESGVSHG